MEPLDATAVEPTDGQPVSADAATPTDETAAQPQSDIPPELLKIPAFSALLAGKPPALSANIKRSEKSPVVKLIADNRKALMDAGVGFYRSLSGDLGVMFNQMAMHPEEIKQADKAGQLLSIAPDFNQVNHALASQLGGPDLSHANPQGSPPPAPPVNPPQLANGGLQPQPAGSQRDIMAKRLMNLGPAKAATVGPIAGQGNLLKNILKPVV